jgi:hypothetical protein
LLLRTALLFVRSAVRLVYAERIARVGTPKVKATWQPNEIQIEVNTAPRKPEGWQGYFNKKVKEFGVYAVYNYSGVDRDGITSFAASEDLERVVKVIDIALEYANDNYEADVLPGDSACLGTLRLGNAEHKATEPAQRQADLDKRAAKLAKPDDP